MASDSSPLRMRRSRSLVVDDRRVLGEVARSGQVQRVVLAERGLVAIEHRIAQVLDVHGDAGKPITNISSSEPPSASVARTGSRCNSSVSRHR